MSHTETTVLTIVALPVMAANLILLADALQRQSRDTRKKKVSSTTGRNAGNQNK